MQDQPTEARTDSLEPVTEAFGQGHAEQDSAERDNAGPDGVTGPSAGAVTRHYSRSALLSSILDAVAAAGRPVAPLDSDDLSPMDEMHAGVRPATVALAEALAPAPGDRVLDLGCGLGGTARYLARHHGCRVTGIDLTRESVEVATELTARCGLAEAVTFRQGDVTALPFPDSSFDGVTLVHVGMNVESKAAMCAQAARVLRPGGRFVVYDVMLRTEDDSDLAYPLPWANNRDLSFLETVAEYRRLLTDAGFTVSAEDDLSELAQAGLRAFAAAEVSGPDELPPVGLHVVMGEGFRTKVGNLAAGIDAGIVAPVRLLAVRA